ncbi:hypothetical protein DVS28_a2932 [Euzebya pacifica]|uniref:Uncharacterized protein n=1 Tax=Euzebya pacifica TaxID=1608957 RepID=A0A346XZG4_9ACTN|nr:hypothetical protein [Euzebya pacifica]AXV07611.1 hypothetical protein DVS28_a2932 [Euzebya pacifica]
MSTSHVTFHPPATQRPTFGKLTPYGDSTASAVAALGLPVVVSLVLMATVSPWFAALLVVAVAHARHHVAGERDRRADHERWAAIKGVVLELRPVAGIDHHDGFAAARARQETLIAELASADRLARMAIEQLAGDPALLPSIEALVWDAACQLQMAEKSVSDLARRDDVDSHDRALARWERFADLAESTIAVLTGFTDALAARAATESNHLQTIEMATSRLEAQVGLSVDADPELARAVAEVKASLTQPA